MHMRRAPALLVAGRAGGTAASEGSSALRVREGGRVLNHALADRVDWSAQKDQAVAEGSSTKQADCAERLLNHVAPTTRVCKPTPLATPESWSMGGG